MSISPFKPIGTAISMPALLPAELKYCERAISEDTLLGSLIKNPMDLVLFFETACADETWSEHNPLFMKKAIAWLTLQGFQGRLPLELSHRSAKAIREHYAVLHEYVPENILFKLKDTAIQGSSLLFAAASDYFRDLLFKECRDKNKMAVSLDITNDVFSYLVAFVTKGEVSELGRKDEKEILQVLKQAALWRFEGLVTECQGYLKKYITTQNVLDFLIQSHQEQWLLLKKECLNFVNQNRLGYQLKVLVDDTISFEFQDFIEAVFKASEKIKPLISEIACTGSLFENEQFGEALRRFPRLKGLDVSGTRFFSTQFLNVNRELQSLNLSQCLWVNQDILKKIADICPHIRKLKLGSDVQLNFAAWGELLKFHQLLALDLTRCSQITDEDFFIILRACLGIRDLSVESCKLIGDRGFNELSRTAMRLSSLNLSRTSISDQALLEITSRCRNLEILDLTRCENLSDKAVLELAKHANSLKELNITQCRISSDAIESIKRSRPYLALTR